MSTNVVTANFKGEWSCITEPLWQWDFGQVLEITGIDDLPSSCEVHFANFSVGSSVSSIASNGRVSIPNQMLTSGNPVYAWIYLSAGETDGETEYKITIPVNRRAMPSDETPTPQDKSALAQAVDALNTAAENAAETVAASIVDDTLAVSGKAADAAVTGQELSDLKSDFDDITETVHSKNVFDPTTAVIGYNIWISDQGKAHENSNSYLSGFIPVSPGDVIRYYRLTSNDTFYNITGTNFAAIAEYSSADESTFIAGATYSNPYTVQSGNYIRFCNPKSHIQDDKINAVTINQELTASTIDYYSISTYPIDNPQVLTNKNDIVSLNTFVNNLDNVTSIGITPYSTAFINFPMLSGVRTDLYHNNILYGCYNRFIGAHCGNGLATNHKDSISFTPNDSSSLTGAVMVYAKNTSDFDDIGQNVSISIKIVKTTDGNGSTKKVLLIGDSMTASGKYQNFVNQYFENDGMTVEWLGTKTSPFGLNHEGRNGWRAYTYTHFASTSSSDGEGEATTNAFWNPSSSKFDFSYYMAQQGYSGVDIVFINLGTNDVGRANHSTDSDITAGWQEMISSIHDYDSNIDIVLWLCPMQCLMLGSSVLTRSTPRMHKIISDNYRSNQWGKNNVWILPSYLALDPVYGFPISTVARNQYDATLVEEPTDTVHPSDSGYHQLANPIIAMIKHIGSL